MAHNLRLTFITASVVSWTPVKGNGANRNFTSHQPYPFVVLPLVHVRTHLAWVQTYNITLGSCPLLFVSFEDTETKIQEKETSVSDRCEKEKRINKRKIIIREPHCYEFESLALQSNAIVGTRVIMKISDKDVGYSTNTALFVSVILTGARFPAAAANDVGFSRWMFEAQPHSRDGRDGILEVSDAYKSIQCFVDEISEFFVPHLEE